MSTYKVIFRASLRKEPDICAVIVGVLGSSVAPLCVWDSQCGHGSGSWGWYYSTRPAKPEEYAGELKKLRRQYAPDKITVRKMHTRADIERLNSQLR